MRLTNLPDIKERFGRGRCRDDVVLTDYGEGAGRGGGAAVGGEAGAGGRVPDGAVAQLAAGLASQQDLVVAGRHAGSVKWAWVIIFGGEGVSTFWKQF